MENLIADDEPDVHKVTRMVLHNFSFDGLKLELISAYNGQEAKNIMAERDDIALAILDVVMEDEHAGLEVARYIREDLHNRYTRLVLRTGQPGQAPKMKSFVIMILMIIRIKPSSPRLS
jgi:CheY-like chemotaxis protein